MQFGIQREVLLKPLQQVIGVVERRQTLPVLSNLLVASTADRVTFTGTDLEVEMSASVEATGAQAGEVTVPARKLFDICRALPDGSKIQFKLTGDRATVSSGPDSAVQGPGPSGTAAVSPVRRIERSKSNASGSANCSPR